MYWGLKTCSYNSSIILRIYYPWHSGLALLQRLNNLHIPFYEIVVSLDPQCRSQ